MERPGIRLPTLCERCQPQDFDKVFSTKVDIPDTGIEVMDLGKTPPDLRKLSCDLCRIFHQARPTYFRKYSLHVRLFDGAPWKLDQVATALPRQRFISVVRKNSRLRYDSDIKDEIIQQGVIGYTPDSNENGCSIHVIDAATVDYERVEAQLRQCHNDHPECALDGSSTSKLPQISLIDCIQGDVVKWKPGDQYMTLSYVWGSQESPAGSSSLSHAPLTVRDAMQVVRALRRKYLWVDRYCIDQSNASEKETMLQNMDLIYEHSEATIVALYGENDQCGLPGVSSISRIPQPYYKTSKGSLVSSCPVITTLIEKSKWNTRGWTYQEARLSRRCVFFSEHQVYIVCRRCTWSETVSNNSGSHIPTILNSQRLSSTLFGTNNNIAGGLFSDRLEYSKRNLTYQEDALEGFRGILRRSQFITVWGVPIILRDADADPNASLALGLLWMKRPGWARSRHIQRTHIDKTFRRNGFPTWSWTSLHAEVYQDHYGPNSKYGQYINGTAVQLPENEASTQFWLCLDGVWFPLIDAINLISREFLFEQSLKLQVEGDFISLRYRYRDEGSRQHRWYHLFSQWRYFQPDIFDEQQEMPGESSENDLESEEEVLVLVQWNDLQGRNSRRLLLMVVEWTDVEHAERRGLLTQYRDEFRIRDVQQASRSRKRFILQ